MDETIQTPADLAKLSAGDHGARALNDLLAKICELDERRDALAAELKSVDAKIAQLEEAAADSIQASGLTGVRAGGRTWWLAQTWHVSVPAANRKEVLRIAETLGKRDEIEAVATATLKAWLVERAKENTASEDGENPSIVRGTPFDGLVGEYRKVDLRSRRV